MPAKRRAPVMKAERKQIGYWLRITPRVNDSRYITLHYPLNPNVSHAAFDDSEPVSTEYDGSIEYAF